MTAVSVVSDDTCAYTVTPVVFATGSCSAVIYPAAALTTGVLG